MDVVVRLMDVSWLCYHMDDAFLCMVVHACRNLYVSIGFRIHIGCMALSWFAYVHTLDREHIHTLFAYAHTSLEIVLRTMDARV